MRWALVGLLLLGGCATREPPPETLLACPPPDFSVLDRCKLPAWLPDDDGEAVLVIWQALLVCVAVVEEVQR